MPIPTLPGVATHTVTTTRLTTRVLFSGPDDGAPVLFLHGNNSSATWWEETMLSLPAGFRGLAPDLRGFGDADPAAKIDATRGAGDWADDVVALLDTLRIAQIHVVGSSLGGMVVWRLLLDHPERLITVTLVDPGSPYGFGGTRDAAGAPCWPDFAGSGAGLVNPAYIERVQAGDAGLEHRFSPRAVLRVGVLRPPFIAAREDELVQAMLSVHIGPQDQPGDKTASPNWPHVAPGVWGASNALSPKYLGSIRRLESISPKPPILWIRGADDLAVSDTALSDPGFLGQRGFLREWPGVAAYPPQPMVSQTRSVLVMYAAGGGRWAEIIIPEAGHAPYLDKLADFNAALHPHLQRRI